MQDLKLRIYAKGAGLKFQDEDLDKTTCGCTVDKKDDDETVDSMEEENRDIVNLTRVGENENEEELKHCAWWLFEHTKIADSDAWKHLQLLCNAAFDDIKKRASLIEKVADKAWAEIPIQTSYRLPKEKKKKMRVECKREGDFKD